MRRPISLTLGLLLWAIPSVADTPGDVCSSFNGNTLQGWFPIAATAGISVPGPDGTPYMRCGDLPSSTVTSAIHAPIEYLGSWEDVFTLEFDFILHEDGWPDESQTLSPVLHLKASPDEGVGERAVFFIDWPVSDPSGAFPGWHHIIAPIHSVAGPALPSNEFGHWVIPFPIVDAATDWNHLLEDVQQFRFIADIAGAPTQLEDFGLDNVCLRRTGPISTTSESWGRVKSAYR